MVKLNNRDLISKYQSTGDSRVLEDIIKNNMGLIVSYAKKYSYTSILDIDDHIQSGRIAVARAARSFDLTEGTKFSTYAGTAIEREIQDYINSSEPSIRIPDHMVLKCKRYIKCVRSLKIKLGRNPTSEEISKEMKISFDDVIKIESSLSTQNYTSLDAPVSPEGSTNTLSNTRQVSEGDFQKK